jgi:hypothetical protein
MENKFKEYYVCNERVKAKPTEGGLFMIVTTLCGELLGKMRIEVFNELATEVEDGHSTE